MGLEGLEGLEGFKSPLSVQICPTVQSRMCPRYAIFCIAESVEDAYNQSQILTPLCSARKSMAWPSPMGLLGHAENRGATASRFFQDSKHGGNSYIKATHHPNMLDSNPTIFFNIKARKKSDAVRRQIYARGRICLAWP